MNDLTRDELRKRAAELKISGRGKMLKPELIAAIEAAEAKQNEQKITGMAKQMAAAVIALRHDQHALKVDSAPVPIKPTTRKILRAARRRPERGMVADGAGGEVMPLHYRGRATGAKHLPPKVRTESVSTAPGWPAGAPLGYDSREDRYIKQRNGSASLTARQERRLRHKANHHNAVMADPR